MAAVGKAQVFGNSQSSSVVVSSPARCMRLQVVDGLVYEDEW